MCSTDFTRILIRNLQYHVQFCYSALYSVYRFSSWKMWKIQLTMNGRAANFNLHFLCSWLFIPFFGLQYLQNNHILFIMKILGTAYTCTIYNQPPPPHYKLKPDKFKLHTGFWTAVVNETLNRLVFNCLPTQLIQ